LTVVDDDMVYVNMSWQTHWHRLWCIGLCQGVIFTFKMSFL